MPVKAVTYPGYDNTSIDDPTMHYLLRLLEFTAPRFVIEAGTYVGHFACIAAAVLVNQHRGGRVWTFDPTDHQSRNWFAQNELTNVEYIQAGFETLGEQKPFLRGMVDFAFIDSGPHGEAPADFPKNLRWSHYELAKQFMRPYGLVVVDDLFGEWDKVEEIRKECLILEGGRGLGVWQKR